MVERCANTCVFNSFIEAVLQLWGTDTQGTLIGRRGQEGEQEPGNTGTTKTRTLETEKDRKTVNQTLFNHPLFQEAPRIITKGDLYEIFLRTIKDPRYYIFYNAIHLKTVPRIHAAIVPVVPQSTMLQKTVHTCY